jgi:glycosyltransferase involved in cell wall biosynthesis
VCRKPVVVTAHGSDILVVADQSSVVRRLVEFVLHHADAVTSVAEHLTERIQEMGVHTRPVLTFPMSVPTGSFCPDGPAREEWAGTSVVFSNRSLYPLYNVELLVRAAPLVVREIPAAVVVIAGEGPERERLAALANKLGVADQVHFIGAVPHEQMPEYLRAASVYVSTALSDGASVSLLEAMACGTFPVVADIPANREWIEDGRTGDLFAPTEEQALAEAIVKSFRQPELRRQARERNVQSVHQKARWESNIDKLAELYADVLRGEGQAMRP